MNDFSKAVRGALRPESDEARERRERLAKGAEKRDLSKSYSSFVRTMRFALPLAALAIIAVLFTWSNLEGELVIPPEGTRAPTSIGKNELVNPRFESKDKKNQPYTITARRAVQGESSDDIIILEKPVADMALSSGNWIAIEADQGAYRQDKNRLLLQGNVKMFHDRGYQLETDKLHVDMKSEQAWSEDVVHAQGPTGTLDAKGLKANSDTGVLIFTGPAKLVLHRAVDGIN